MQKRQDTIIVTDAHELISYVEMRVVDSLSEIEKAGLPVSPDKFLVKRVADSIIENAIYSVLQNSLGYVITYVQNPTSNVLYNHPNSRKILLRLKEYVELLLVNTLVDTFKLNINYSYYIRVMVSNTHVHILISR